jgi:hypothetical protein
MRHHLNELAAAAESTKQSAEARKAARRATFVSAFADDLRPLLSSRLTGMIVPTIVSPRCFMSMRKQPRLIHVAHVIRVVRVVRGLNCPWLELSVMSVAHRGGFSSVICRIHRPRTDPVPSAIPPRRRTTVRPNGLAADCPR